ncbi:polyketide synthase [Thermothielavioides terrestris NRRL 8126]|uniref:Polyketide synthase n=1 Tax=Thermothielavioides terrestris (strain ATCC 38088 / NRRL 8126) TaxID=578455 RepID=G2R8Q8_THETT|nr:polyketide synthase [Thermothielavioides terrestris NRRL 8126]AEO68274.1 polyketide synthase [Thermothielavioides terrestris NRRL 8126]
MAADGSAPEPVAIVGVSCRLPGGANHPDSFWSLLSQGTSAWTPVPADRFNETAFWHPSADHPSATNHQGGHFITGDVRDFDHAFFHLSPAQAAAMDPQQRILLELTYEALEAAGWPLERARGTRTAVHAAIFTTDYDRSLTKDLLDLPAYYTIGTGMAILANRVSHALDLRGPSVTLDTGCSGGLVALHQACLSLRDGEADAAVVAAANLSLAPDAYVGMSNLHMLSSTGRCYPFDVRGEGYGRGEGFVVMVLKRLRDALRDRDPIRSVVLGTGVNQDGYTASGITHPSRSAQADLIRSVYARLGLRPHDTAYVEAHGTGTVAGDQEELAAIADVFTGTDRSLPLYVGSNKGSIGHTESTSGLASVLKAALILDHKTIPPVAGFANPKPGLPLDVIRIPTEQIPWPHAAGVTPRVSVNSFGYGGTNAHAILERGPYLQQQQNSASSLAPSPRLFILSANSRASLTAMIQSHRDWVEQRDEVPLADLSYTLCQRRSLLPWRFSCVAQDRDSLLEALGQGLASPPKERVPAKPDVLFIFTGQGAQWAGMGRELLQAATPSPVFRDSIRASRDMLHSLGAAWDLEVELLREDSDKINEAQIAQPATTAVQIALAALLRALGVRPSAVVGHSSGEIAAAYTAGRLSHRAALRVAFHRGFVADVCKTRGLPRGAMLAVGLGPQDAEPHLRDLTRGEARIACINSPSSVTISGDADAVDEVAARIAARGDGTFCRKLRVDTAYHSHHMRAVADEYRERLGDMDVEAPPSTGDQGNIAFISSVTGLPWSDELDSSYWVNNLVSPVRFSDAVQTLARRHHDHGGGHAFFVEVGPHSALAGPVRQCLAAQDVPSFEYEYRSALQRKVSAVSSALALTGSLVERGIEVNLEAAAALAPGLVTAAVLPDLPAYAWDHSTKHWHESRLSREHRLRAEPYHDLLGVRITDSTSLEPRWRHLFGLSTLPWLADHVVDGLVVFPGAGYLCMAAEAVAQLAREQAPQRELELVVFRDVSFVRALVVPDAPQRVEAQLTLKSQPDAPFHFTFSVTALSDGQWHEYCTGVVQGLLAADKADAGPHGMKDAGIKMSAPSAEELGADATTSQGKEIYLEMAAAGNKYGPTFAGIRSLTVKADGSKVNALVEVPDIAATMPARHQAPHFIHPATLDVVLHTALPAVWRRLGTGSVMPVRIGELLVSTTKDAHALHTPGAEVQVSAQLTSEQFRTVWSDASVLTAEGGLVLAGSAIELRSMAAQPARPDGAADSEGICYELEWQPDIDYLRAEDLPQNPILADLVGHICFKRANLSVLELGGGSGDLALEFLGAINDHDGTLATYDFTDTTSGLFEEARKRLVGHPQVHSRALDPKDDAASQGFAEHSYDVVLASDVGALPAQVTALAKTGGLLVLVLPPGADPGWRAALQRTCPTVDVQLTFTDAAGGRLVVVARFAHAKADLAGQVKILTHSSSASAALPWAAALEAGLRDKGVSTGPPDALATGAPPAAADTDAVSAPILVLDDQPQPILDDPQCFDAAVALLRRPGAMVWLSPDSPLPMHKITGVARTAHAENVGLRLTTVHASAGALLQQQAGDDPQANRLLEVLARSLAQVAADGRGAAAAHWEREYRVRDDGAVLIPRLRRSARLNRAVLHSHGEQLKGAQAHSHNIKTQTCRFLDGARRLVLAADSSDDVFVDEDEDEGNILPDNVVEIETRAFVLSESDGPYAYCGNVAGAGGPAKIGVGDGAGASAGDVDALLPGTPVVALSPAAGASRPRVARAHIARLPPGVPAAAGAALFLPTLAACHALHNLARLTPSAVGASVLVHNPLSDVGRAAVAVARRLGARVLATAADAVAARRVSELLEIDPEHVLVTRESLSLSPRRGNPGYLAPGTIDAIILAGSERVPSAAWAGLKPFGVVVDAVGNGAAPRRVSPSLAGELQPHKLPPNASLHLCRISDLLRARPDMIAELVARAGPALAEVPLRGFDPPLYDVAQLADARRLLRTSTAWVVIEAAPSSLVRASVGPRQPSDDELVSHALDPDGAYVVAGGLGDLGWRWVLLLARRGARRIVTLSRRRAEPEEIRERQAQLEQESPAGCCQLTCVACDITDESALRASVAALVREGLPPVRGVIQSTSVFKDSTLESITFDDFRLVSHVKTDGTLVLDRVFAGPQLQFFIALSSAVNIVGTAGQSAYNAGNAVKDAVARARGPGYLSLNIGWIEDAVHTVSHEVRLQAIRRAGLRPISHAELSRFFDYALGAAAKHIPPLPQAIIGFDTGSLARATTRNGTMHSALFCHVRQQDNAAPAKEASFSASKTPGAEMSLRETIERCTDPEAVIHLIARAMAGQLVKLGSADAKQASERAGSILDLGLDSLVAIELRNWIARELDAPLQTSEILTTQTFGDLARKVARRSAIVLAAGQRAQETRSSADKMEKQEAATPPLSIDSASPTPNSTSTVATTAPSPTRPLSAEPAPPKLPPLPLPALEDTLRAFEDSRRAIDSESDQRETADAVRAFLEGPGPALLRRLEAAGPDSIADAYERQVYLERRDSTIEADQFSLFHPVEGAPAHSQAMRAAVLTVAAMEFARRVADGTMAPDTLHGEPVNSEGREWLFYATRLPAPGLDRMERYPPNHTVAVLRRGHIFLLSLPDGQSPLHLSAVRAAFQEILRASEEPRPSVCTLTADDRDSWASIRRDLEQDPNNATTLAAISAAAFVVCLDDESPAGSTDRYTQFLLNGLRRPFANRWLDKTFQLVVTANGLSAETYEHAKLDGLDPRSLHAHLLRSLQQDSCTIPTAGSSSGEASPIGIQELTWNNISPAALQRIEHIQDRWRAFGPFDNRVVDVSRLSLDALRASRAPPNAAAHFTALLAVHLVDGEPSPRPAWENVSLGGFARGRIEWVQTVSEATRDFVVQAAAGAAATAADRDRSAQLRALFDRAAASYARALVEAGRGHGVVGPMYALHFAATSAAADDAREVAAATAAEQNLPALFRTRAWAATRRGGPGQDVKLGFARFVPDDFDAEHWDAGGFLMQGERGVYIHCGVRNGHTRFSVSAKPAYAARVAEALGRAGDIVAGVLGLA